MKIDKGKPCKSGVLALTWYEKGVKKSMPVNDPLLLRLIREGKIANVVNKRGKNDSSNIIKR